jgi:hypothetical protein
LKRKENALVLSLGSFIGPKIDWTAGAIKMIENNMLDRRFSVAPMMDWTGTSRKAKHNQHLNGGAVDRAVPNAVPIVRLMPGSYLPV